MNEQWFCWWYGRRSKIAPIEPSMVDSATSAQLQQLQQENHRLRQEVEALKQRLQLVNAQQQQPTDQAAHTPQQPTAGVRSNPADPTLIPARSEDNSAAGLAASRTGNASTSTTPTAVPPTTANPLPVPACSIASARPASIGTHGLTKAQVERYSRQLLLPAFGPAAQARLCSASALIVGCGGLGAPAALYLAAAGIGSLGLADRDTVELSNLHRQVIHAEDRVGQHKAASAAASCHAINSSVQLRQHVEGLTPGNAVQLVASYDVVLDCSDNAATRYLMSDACAACHVPLVSAAALGTDGQLTVYCHGHDGPCYRCLFPTPPAAQHCGRCSEAGVLGPVPGVMGVLQALEALKLLIGVGEPLSRKLLLFDALSGRFSTVRLRGRVQGCLACGGGAADSDASSHQNGTPADAAAAAAAAAAVGVVTRENIASYDYTAFTGQAAHDGPDEDLDLLPREQRVSPQELALALGLASSPRHGQAAEVTTNQPLTGKGSVTIAAASPYAAGLGSGAHEAQAHAVSQLDGQAPQPPVVLDVRPATQFNIMALPGAIHVPIEQLEGRLAEVVQLVQRQDASTAMSTNRTQHACESAVSNRSRDDGADRNSVSSQSATDNSNGSSSTMQHTNHGSEHSLPPVYVVCRRGNDSQLAVQLLRRAGIHTAVDLIGGYQSWAREVDNNMPVL